MKRLVCLLCFLLLTPCCPAQAVRARKSALQLKVERMVANHPDWRVGVAVWFLDGDTVTRKAEVEADRPLALASVFKVPVLVELARQIESKQGGLQLSTGLTVSESEKCIGSGRLLHQPSGTVVKVERLIELMETISDNTATDMLFRRIGLASVNRMLESLGCKNSDICLTNRGAWLISLGQSSDFRSMSPAQIADKWRKLDKEGHRAAGQRAEKENLKLSLSQFQRLEDLSDQKQTYAQNVLVATTVDNRSSANDLALVLSQLYQGKAVNSELTRFCLGVLSRQHFNTRIPRHLPAGTQVYHKTGTIAGVVNDIGVIAVPDHGAAVVVVLVNQVGSGENSAADELIGQIARAAYDELAR